jgi:hypothetical protein
LVLNIRLFFLFLSNVEKKIKPALSELRNCPQEISGNCILQKEKARKKIIIIKKASLILIILYCTRIAHKKDCTVLYCTRMAPTKKCTVLYRRVRMR